jgi:hypothetical protein
MARLTTIKNKCIFCYKIIFFEQCLLIENFFPYNYVEHQPGIYYPKSHCMNTFRRRFTSPRVQTYAFQFIFWSTIKDRSENSIKRFKIEFLTILSLSVSKYFNSVTLYAQSTDSKRVELVINPVLENRLIPKSRI